MKTLIKFSFLIFVSLGFASSSSAQTKYWGMGFREASKSKAIYFSTDQKIDKEKKRSYYRIQDSIRVREDILTKGGQPINMSSYYLSGKTKEVINFVGKGKSRQKSSYREGGTLKATYQYDKFGRLSHTVVYDKKGLIVFDRKSEGPPLTYSGGKTRNRLTFKQNGALSYFYDTGEKLLTLDFEDGEPKGTTASWYKNGQLRTSNGANEIPIKWWHLNGELAVKHENSTVFRYDTSGVLREEYEIKEYRLDGPHAYYYPNTKLSVSGQNKEGKRIGIWQFFSQEGNLLKEIDFDIEKQEPRVIERSTLLLRKSIENPDPGMFYAGIPDFFDQRFHADQDPWPLNIGAVKQWVGYPVQARDKRIQGQVVFRLLVDEKGQLVWYKTVNQVHPILCHAAEQYLFDLIFEPAYRDGEAIPSWINFPFNFRLLN